MKSPRRLGRKRLYIAWVLALTPAILEAQNAPTPPSKISGYHFQAADTQALQDDNFANPGLLWVDQGESLWQTPSPGNGKSCADCHGGAADSMVGVATQYPKFDSDSASLLNLEGRINRCRSEHQDLPPLEYESDKLLALTAYVGFQSRGLPMDVDIEGPAQAFFEAGQRYYYQRRGQMNLACHHCHEQNVGNKLRGDTLSQGQATGYPIYRLEWQTLGSLHRRLRFCNIGVRAEPFAFGAQPYINLELYLAWRAAGLPLETPAVRR